MNLHIFYRHYNTSLGISKRRPAWFSYESCLANLFETLSKASDSKIFFTLVFDGSEFDYKSDFSSKLIEAWSGQHQNFLIDLKLINAGSDKSSFAQTVAIAESDELVRDEDLVYLLENDYLHIDKWVNALKILSASNIPWDYVSLYDHYDKYPFHPKFHKKYHKLQSMIYVTESNHWRSAPSTCGSFVTRGKTLREDEYFLKKFKDRKLQPILKLLKNRLLVTALPGLSTHCMDGLLTPIVDWEKIANS